MANPSFNPEQNRTAHRHPDKPLNDNEQRMFVVHTTGQRQLEVLAAIVEERAYQDRKHGHPDDNPHSMGAWALVIRKELEEFETAIIKGGMGRDNAINELIQIAASCAAALEQWGVEPVTGRCL